VLLAAFAPVALPCVGPLSVAAVGVGQWAAKCGHVQHVEVEIAWRRSWHIEQAVGEWVE
jgi:hypothetical protein